MKGLRIRNCVLTFLFLTLSSVVVVGARAADTRAPTGAVASYGSLPLSFEANRGQTDGRVQFLARGHGYTLYLTATEAVFGLAEPSSNRHGAGQRRAALRIILVGSNPASETSGIDPLPGNANYFLGNNRAQWRTDVPTYERVRYRAVYPGVDLIYYGHQGQLEYDFILAPGADPNLIRLEIRGAHKVRLVPQGELTIATEYGELRFHEPRIYQEVDGVKQPVAGRYVLRGKHQVGFRLGPYDASKPLTIDPVLVYATYLGGSSYDYVEAITADAAGSAFVTGLTSSIDFPIEQPYQTTNHGNTDVFVAKLNPAGTALVYSTYLGGSGGDEARGIALDSAGNAYIAGATYSTDLPTVNPLQSAHGGGFWDAFVAKIGPAGNALLYSTYFGGSGEESAEGIALDSLGNLYFTGYTSSSNLPLQNPLQPTHGGGFHDLYLAKLNPAGSALLYSTYLGGNAYDYPRDFKVDTSGNAYVTGDTASVNFPTTPGALQTTFGGGGVDAFVTKIRPDGSALLYSTYLGGSLDDRGYGIAVDSAGNAYITGPTGCVNFPAVNPYHLVFTGAPHVFVSKLNPLGSALVYSTLLGGSAFEDGMAITVDGAGNASVTGWTFSSDFPTTSDAWQPTYGGDREGYMSKLDSTGSTLLYSSYIGGLSQDQGRAITVDSKGDLYVAAATTSSGLPTTPGALQPALAGDFDIFILKLSFNRPPVAEAGPDQTVECTGYSGANVTLDGSASSDPDNDPLTYEWRDADGNLVGSTAQVMLTLSRGTHDFTLSVNDGRGGTNSDTVGIVVRDTTAPTLTLTKASTTVVLPSAAAAGAAVDVLAASGSAASDVCDPSPVITHNGLPLYPIGTTQVTITATDNCGNYSQKPFTVQVVYNFFGFLPPVRNDGSSVFNAGRTVPVKFQLTAADGTVIRNAVATLQVFEINGEEIFPESSGASNTGNLFRFGDQYIYNLSTKGYTLGSYLLRVSLNDQTKHEVWVSLR